MPVVAPPLYITNPNGQLEDITEAARSQVFCGEGRDKVWLFLRARGVPAVDADQVVVALLTERADLIRQAGLRRLRFGVPLMAIPFLYNLVTAWLGGWLIWLFVPIAVVGTVGIAKIWNGLLMRFRPDDFSGNLTQIIG